MGGIFYSILSVVLPSIFQLIYLSFSAHRIGREDFGSYAFLLLLITSFTQFSMAIPLQAYLRFYNSASSKENFKNSYRLVAIYLSALGACYTLLLAFIYGDRFSAATYLSIAISIYLICNFSIECQSLLLSLQRKKYFSIKIVESLAKFVFPILFYIMSEDPDFLIFGYLSGYLICNLPFLNIKSILRTKIRIEEFKEQFFYAYPIIFSTISSMIISFSDRFFIDIFLPKSSLGEYTLMYQFSSFAQVIGVLFSIII
ncbi:oligosaccharide flippase family protein, partial [Vibrio vulnificus]